MQVCWVRFSKYDNFHTPSFFNSYFPEINEPSIGRIDSDPSFKVLDCLNVNPTHCTIKIC